MDKELLVKLKAEIDERLKDMFDNKLNNLKNISNVATELVENAAEFTLRGGKRLRPILLKTGYYGYGGKNHRCIANAALSIELMESFLLMHDDIMDEDDLRRGKPTMHKVFEKKYDAKTGESLAIATGDMLAVLGTNAIINSRFPEKYKLKAVLRFNRAVIDTCIGQAHDLISANKDLSEKEILEMYLLKTAKYTVEAPFAIGALLAGVPDNEIRKISCFALPLGQAFQIQDDILGLYSNEKKLGKPVGNDIKEGKKTLLITKAINKIKADKSKSSFLNKCLGNKNLSKKDIEKTAKIVKDCGAYNETKAVAEKLLKKAKAGILKTNIQPKEKKFMLSIADYLIERKL